MNNSRFVIICFAFVCLWLNSCKNIYEDFGAPSIEIVSIKVLSKDSCEIALKINRGVGASFKSSYLSFSDMADTTKNFVSKFDLKSDKEQTYTLKVKVQQAYHDYKVQAVLESEKNTYSSIPKTIYLSRDYDETNIAITHIDIVNLDETYLDIYHGIGANAVKGKWIGLSVYYTKSPPFNCTIEVKLNDFIIVPSERDTSVLTGATDGSFYCQVTIPQNLPVGDYSVYFYINGQRFLATSKIRILPGSSSSFIVDDPPANWYSYGSLYTYFTIGSKVYYLYRQPERTVFTYDLESKMWARKNNFTFPIGYDQYSWVLPPQIEYNNEKYVLVKLYSDGISLFSSVELWKYNSELDTWEKQATYPGDGVERFATFVVGDKLYMGGGINKADSWINVNDFWAYDFKLKTWTKKIDIPQIISQNLVSSCYSPTGGFAFTKYRELYQYNPVSDTWSTLNSLNGGPTTRFTTTILYNNNKLYVVSGGSYDSGVWSSLRDTWSYDLDTNIWSLRDVFDKNLADGTTPTFMYKGKIYVGFGMQYYDETKFFIEINP